MGVIIPAIPYKSQYDPDAEEFRNDCGPAALAMILRGYGVNISTDAVYRATGTRAHRYVGIGQLMRVAEAHGVLFDFFYGWSLEQLMAVVSAGHPAIATVHYGAWSRIDPGVSTQNRFEGPHFVVVVGHDDEYMYVNDPLWKEERREEGFRKAWTHAQFYEAWNSNHLDGNRDRSGIVARRPLATQAYGRAEWPRRRRILSQPSDRLRALAWAEHIGVPRPNPDQPASLKAYLAAMGNWGARTAEHEVKHSDDLALLAMRYYGDVKKWRVIMAFNGLAQTDTLQEGDVLYIPEPLETPQPLPGDGQPLNGSFTHADLEKEPDLA